MAEINPAAQRTRGPAIRQAHLARVRMIRRRVIAGAVSLFVATWLLIAIMLVTGHDPALSASSAAVVSGDAATTGGQASSGATSGEATGTSGSDSGTSTPGSSTTAANSGSAGAASTSSGSSSGGAVSSVTTRQS